MALAHEADLRNAMAQAVSDAVDSGAGTATFRLLDASDTVIYTFSLSDPAFTAPSGGNITLSGQPLLEQAEAGGQITKFELRDKDGTNIITGSAASVGGDITVEKETVELGESATLEFAWNAPI